MAASARYRLVKQGPTDVWSTRERLALGCSVMRSGDQNWVSVSRAIRPFGESSRPSDWFSQKNCALQYSELLENVETHKRKRGEREVTETPGDVIVRKLTIERIEELKRIVQEEQQKYKRLQEDVERIRAGQVDDVIQEMWGELHRKMEAESDVKKEPEESVAPSEGDRKVPGLKLALTSAASEDEGAADSTAEQGSVDDENSQSAASSSITPLPVSADSKARASPPHSPQLARLPHHGGEEAFQEELNRKLLQQQQQQHQHQQQQQQQDLASSSVDTKDDIILTTEIKQEPADVVEIMPDDSTIFKEEPPEVSDNESMSTSIKIEPQELDVKLEEDCDKVDKLKSPTQTARKYSREKIHDIEIPLQDDMRPLPEPDEAPLSPANSDLSCVSDSGSIRGRGGRRSRGRGGRRGRRSTRKFVEAKESETSSKAESSDDDGCPQESDDTSSNLTGRGQFLESVPNSPASIAPGDTEDEKAHKLWKKSIMLVWRAAANHKYANVFLHPVTEDIAPGYHSVVFRPMDLSTIKKNIEGATIKTTAEFQRDMMLMFTNAIMYNNSDHDVYHMAEVMYNDIMYNIEQFVNTQMMVQAEPKILRTSRRSDVHSDKEEETKRKRTTSEQEQGGKTKKRKI